MHLLESVRWFDGLHPKGVSRGHSRVCELARRRGGVLPAAAQHSLHTVTLWGIFINIPISAVPDCSICRNKLGIVFDIRLKTLWQEETHKYEFVCMAHIEIWSMSQARAITPLLFKCLCTTRAPGESLSCTRSTASWKLPVRPEVIGTFPGFSRDPLLSLFPFSLQLTDSPNGGAWQSPSSAKYTLYSHREAALRWKDEGKTEGVIHRVSQFTGLSHSPQSAEGFTKS